MSKTMNPDIKAKWVQALRSGKYEQGKQCLHNLADNSFCCLGVLTDLAVKDGINMTIGVDAKKDKNGLATTYDSERDFLPIKVSEWAGIEDHNPKVDPKSLTKYAGRVKVYGTSPTTLSFLNDDNVSFSTIADIIENEL